MNLSKLTFVGDVMCDAEVVKSARKEGNFNFLFENVKDLFAESHFVVANLETPMAGKQAKYSRSFFSFNAPDIFADAIHGAGIDMVLTANNHCLDRDIAGLCRTLRILDEKGIQHHGTFLSKSERSSYFPVILNSTRVGILSYTYGTNYDANGNALPEQVGGMVNLLRPQAQSDYHKEEKNWKGKLFDLLFSEDNKIRVLKALHKSYYSPLVDNTIDENAMKPYLEQLVRDLKKARQECDVVIFCPHIGGQFNSGPGRYSEYVFQIAREAGCDAIIASHPHVVQKADLHDGTPRFFSLGNFSMSPETEYALHEYLPEYGLAVHLYVGDGAVQKTTFSILKMVLDKNKHLSVFSVDDLYNRCASREIAERLLQDVQFIWQRVIRKECPESQSIKREYDLIEE